jgi:hypothetical protein
MMSLLMVACGGGGSDSAPEPAPAVVVEEVAVTVVEVPTEVVVVEPEQEPDPEAIYETTAELIASKSFLLEQEYELTVSYQNQNRRSTYLSVCTEFTEGPQGIKVNYNSCLLRTSIDNDYKGKLMVANDQNRLVMAIWYLDDTKNPRYEIWENDLDSNDVRNFEVN